MDEYNLERFVDRQKESYDVAYKELSRGMKQSHWMWWIFPQIIGLGMTSISIALFLVAAPEEKLFQQVLDKFFNGRKDDRTINILKSI